QRLDRVLQIVDGTRQGREMEYAGKRSPKGAVASHGLRDIGFDERESPLAFQVAQVVEVAGDHVVDADHFVAFAQEPVAQVRAKESRGARDEYSHALRSRPME